MNLSQKILKQLIQIKSYSGQEKELVDYIIGPLFLALSLIAAPVAILI